MGWMRTGDLGYLTAEGNIVVAGGRLRDMIIRGGENIYPVEIENMIRAHPAVSDIAVFAVPDHYYGEIVGAAITLAADATAEELRAYCDGRIAKFKVPARLYRVARIPTDRERENPQDRIAGLWPKPKRSYRWRNQTFVRHKSDGVPTSVFEPVFKHP